MIDMLFVSMLIIAVFFLIAKIFSWALNRVVLKIAQKTDSLLDDEIITNLNSPIFFTILIIGVYVVLVVNSVGGELGLFLLNVIRTILILVWLLALYAIIKIFLEYGVLFGKQMYNQTTLRNDIAPLLKNLLKIILWFGGTALICQIWGINIAPLLASAGIAGVAVAFAAQDTIAHLFGGLSIYLDKPFRVGDRIKLDKGEVGDVLEIGMRSTRIKTFDETVIIIPNKIIANAKIINYNQPKLKIKVKVRILLPLDVDVEKILPELLEVVSAVEGIETMPQPKVYFTAFGEYALRFLIVVWVESPHKSFSVRLRLNRAIVQFLKRKKIKIPYPSQNVYLKNK